MLMVTAPQDEPLVVGKVRGLVVVVGRSWPYLFALLGLALAFAVATLAGR